MWITPKRLRRLGFRPVNRSCWICRSGYGLIAHEHLSIFPSPDRPGRAALGVEVDAFHITFELGPHNVHAYAREVGPGAWEAEGHTPSWAIRALGYDPATLLREADATAAALVAALGDGWDGSSWR